MGVTVKLDRENLERAIKQTRAKVIKIHIPYTKTDVVHTRKIALVLKERMKVVQKTGDSEQVDFTTYHINMIAKQLGLPTEWFYKEW